MCSGAQSFPVTRIGPTRQTGDRSPARHLGSTHAGRGFPHSEISGSKFVRNSPELIAAYHVLHRLSVPRHPPNALKTLDLTLSAKRRFSSPSRLVPCRGRPPPTITASYPSCHSA